jgi:hypothetical protein
LIYVRRLWPCSGVYLQNTKITDAGLKHLYGLPVYEIDLTGTNISEAAIKKLVATLPHRTNCQIRR